MWKLKTVVLGAMRQESSARSVAPEARSRQLMVRADAGAIRQQSHQKAQSFQGIVN